MISRSYNDIRADMKKRRTRSQAEGPADVQPLPRLIPRVRNYEFVVKILRRPVNINDPGREVVAFAAIDISRTWQNICRLSILSARKASTAAFLAP
jgi:hypothetical protein